MSELKQAKEEILKIIDIDELKHKLEMNENAVNNLIENIFKLKNFNYKNNKLVKTEKKFNISSLIKIIYILIEMNRKSQQKINLLIY